LTSCRKSERSANWHLLNQKRTGKPREKKFMCVCVYVCVCECVFFFTAGHSPIMCSLYLECGLSTTSVFSRVLSCSLVFSRVLCSLYHERVLSCSLVLSRVLCVLSTTSVFSRVLSCSLVFSRVLCSLPRACSLVLSRVVSCSMCSLYHEQSGMRPLLHSRSLLIVGLF
jgi:hypothetical protein